MEDIFFYVLFLRGKICKGVTNVKEKEREIKTYRTARAEDSRANKVRQNEKG